MKATLREKKIANHRKSLYLDFYPPIARPDSGKQTRREFLNLFIYEKPKDEIERRHNKETKILAQNIAAKRQLEIQAGNYGFLAKSSKTKDFLLYFREKVDKRGVSNSTRKNWDHTLLYLSDFCGNVCVMSQINQRFVTEFRDYLLNCRSRVSAKMKLSPNTAAAFFFRFCTIVRLAYEDKLLPEDPASKVERIKNKDTSRAYLTIEELQKLAATSYDLPQVVRSAALFSALTGLRFSDIEALTWQNVRHSEGQGHYLEFKIRKTGEHLTLPISDEAFDLLEPRTTDTMQIFEGLRYSSHISIQIGRWAIAAGIIKPITFHSFRHTFATAQLTLGTDLYTVSKLLGHKSIQHTQIYARIIDQRKREAAGKIKLK